MFILIKIFFSFSSPCQLSGHVGLSILSILRHFCLVVESNILTNLKIVGGITAGVSRCLFLSFLSSLTLYIAGYCYIPYRQVGSKAGKPHLNQEGRGVRFRRDSPPPLRPESELKSTRQSGPRLAVLLSVDRITTSPGRFSVEAAYRIFPPPSTGPIGFSGTN